MQANMKLVNTASLGAVKTVQLVSTRPSATLQLVAESRGEPPEGRTHSAFCTVPVLCKIPSQCTNTYDYIMHHV